MTKNNKRQPRKPQAPRAISDQALREALVRQAQPKRTLPASWHDEYLAEDMAAHIKRVGA